METSPAFETAALVLGTLALIVGAIGVALICLPRRKCECDAPQRQISPDQVEADDPLMREAIARAFNTGRMVIGNRDEDGNVEIREVEE